MPNVDHHGRRTAYRVGGDADSDHHVCCLHGSGGSHAVWAAQLGGPFPAEIVAPDLSGHGDSDDVSAEAGPETLAVYVEDAVAVARAAGADVLVGNSLGGAVALQVALEADLDLAALVLVGTGAKLAVHDDLRAALTDDFEAAIEAIHGPDMVFHDASEPAIERSETLMRETGQAVTRRDFLTCHTFDVRDRLGEIDCPVLAVTGEHDRLTPPRYHEYLAEHVSDGRWATIPGAAHLSMVERPGAFASVVGDFLGTI